MLTLILDGDVTWQRSVLATFRNNMRVFKVKAEVLLKTEAIWSVRTSKTHHIYFLCHNDKKKGLKKIFNITL
jgi:hypothetical protein